MQPTHSASLCSLRRALLLTFILLGAIYFWLQDQEIRIFHRLSCEGPYCFVATPQEESPSQACKIPKINLYHKSFIHMIKPSKLSSNCTKFHSFPLLFNSTVENELIPVVSMDRFKSLRIRSCCYRYGTRANGDLSFLLSNLCYPVSLEHSTRIPWGHEFIAIYCSNALSPEAPYKISDTKNSCVDVHVFAPMKPEVKRRISNISKDGVDVQRPSVAIFGIDAVAKANFLRTMPKTHKYMTEVLGAVEVQGYNKVGDHTMPNLAKLLTSKSYETLAATCAKTQYYDDCPFIWKDFAKKGYVTAFVEDNILSTFDRASVKAKGFRRREPTDYYPRVFVHISDNYFRRRQKGTGCQGPRLFYTTLLGYLEKFMYTMNKESQPFFFFSWEGSLTHDDLNDAALGDEPTVRSLTWMHENNQLDNTIFIFMSDHGMHQKNVLKYRQGQLEDRLPPLYFIFPEWFKKKYRRAIYNFQMNIKRFTNTLDIYYTLQDILNLDQLEDDVLKRREEELHFQFRNENITPPPKGISMFLPMPLARHCRHTYVEEEYCICHMSAPVEVKDIEVVDATLYAIRIMNKKIEKYEKCLGLLLKKIKKADWNLNPDERLRYTIKFQTKFVGGVTKKGISPEFEAVVQRNLSSISRWKVIGNVTSLNTYSNNVTSCLPEGVKNPYCFCR